jgi:hypothetical protein
MEIKTKILFVIAGVVSSIGIALYFGYLSSSFYKKFLFEKDSYIQGKMIQNISFYKNARNILFFLSLFIFIIMILCL